MSPRFRIESREAVSHNEAPVVSAGKELIEGGIDMGDRNDRVGGKARLVEVACGMIVAAMFITGCAGEQQKPMAQPSADQVKGNADRGFDKLKQEEREHKPAGM